MNANLLTPEFERALRAIAPVLGRAVIVGGWAHRLHVLHPLASASREPLTTTDCDVALPLEMAGGGEVDLDTRLEKEGFQCEFFGDERHSVRRYMLSDGDGFYVQFITPRRGGPVRSDGSSNRSAEVAGILAESLRFVDLALRSPWTTHLDLSAGEPFDVRVAHPMAFLLGKMLVSRANSRSREDRAKDLLYIADTLSMFEASLDELRAEGGKHLKSLPERTVRRTGDAIRSHLSGSGSDELHAAAEMTREAGGDRPDSAEELRRVLRHGLWLLWGDSPAFPPDLFAAGDS